MLFIDLNSPLDSAIDVMDKTWASDMRNVLDDHDVPTAEKPDPLTLLGIANSSYHYQEGEPVLGAEHLLIRAGFVGHDVDPELLDRIFAAVAGYGFIPNIEEDSPTMSRSQINPD